MGPGCPPPRRLNSHPFGTAPVFTPGRRDWFLPALAVITEGFLYRMVITKDKHAGSKRLPEQNK